MVNKVISLDLISNPQQIGGPGHIVAIDESVVVKQKPENMPACLVTKQWVFGGID